MFVSVCHNFLFNFTAECEGGTFVKDHSSRGRHGVRVTGSQGLRDVRVTGSQGLRDVRVTGSQGLRGVRGSEPQGRHGVRGSEPQDCHELSSPISCTCLCMFVSVCHYFLFNFTAECEGGTFVIDHSSRGRRGVRVTEPQGRRGV